MSNTPFSCKSIRKINPRRYEITIYLKDEYLCFDKVIDIKVPLYDLCNEDSGVTIESCNPDIEVIELDNTHVRIKLCKEVKYLCFDLLFPVHVNEHNVWKYISKLLLSNVMQENPKYKLANYKLTLDSKHLKIKDIEHPIFIYFIDDLGYYGIITKENIVNNNIKISKDASFITIFPQFAYIKMGRKVYLNEKSIFDVTTDAANISLNFCKSVNIAVSFIDIYYEVNDKEQRDILKDLIKRYGEFEVYNADTGLVYANNISIKDSTTVIQVEKLPVRLKVKAYTRDEYDRKLCLAKITSSTEIEPEYVTSNNALLGTLTVYKKFSKSHLKVAVHNRGTGNTFPLRNIYLELIDYAKGCVVKASDTSKLNVGLYKINKIWCDNNDHKVILDEIVSEYWCNKEIYKDKSRLHKQECKYLPKSCVWLVVNSPETVVHIYGVCNSSLLYKVPHNLKLWGWILDTDTSKFIKHNRDGSIDLDLDVKLNNCDISLQQAIRKHYTNVVILEYANVYSNCTISLGNCRFNNVFDMHDQKTISLYTNMTKSRQDLNNMSCILGLNIGNSVNLCNLPGWLNAKEAKILRSGHKEVREFVYEFCNLNNHRFYNMLKDIVSLLFMSNYINVEINESVVDYPGYIILFARAIKVLNDILIMNGIESMAGYSISLPIHYGGTEKTLPVFENGGVDKKFRHQFLKNKLKNIMKDNEFVQQPLYISTYFRTLMDAPPTCDYEKYLVESCSQSQEVLQGLLNTCNTIETNSRVACSVIGYVYEPRGTNYHAIDSEALCKMAKQVCKTGNLGLVNRINESNSNNCNRYGYRGVYETRKLKSKYYKDIFDNNPNNNYELINNYGYKIIDLHKINEIFVNYSEKHTPSLERCHYLEERGIIHNESDYEHIKHKYKEYDDGEIKHHEQHEHEHDHDHEHEHDYVHDHEHDHSELELSSSECESDNESDGYSDIENCYHKPKKCEQECNE